MEMQMELTSVLMTFMICKEEVIILAIRSECSSLDGQIFKDFEIMLKQQLMILKLMINRPLGSDGLMN